MYDLDTMTDQEILDAIKAEEAADTINDNLQMLPTQGHPLAPNHS